MVERRDAVRGSRSHVEVRLLAGSHDDRHAALARAAPDPRRPRAPVGDALGRGVLHVFERDEHPLGWLNYVRHSRAVCITDALTLSITGRTPKRERIRRGLTRPWAQDDGREPKLRFRTGHVASPFETLFSLGVATPKTAEE